MTRAVLVPSALLLLPEYAGITDPVPALRTACRDAVAALVAGGPATVGVVASPARGDNVRRGVPRSAGLRVACHLLSTAGWSGRVVDAGPGPSPGVPLLVVGNGTACRSEKAPGHLDPRAVGYDTALEDALVRADREALAALDVGLGEQLWCHDVETFRRFGHLLRPGLPAEIAYAADPFGVQYWVMRWP